MPAAAESGGLDLPHRAPPGFCQRSGGAVYALSESESCLRSGAGGRAGWVRDAGSGPVNRRNKEKPGRFLSRVCLRSAEETLSRSVGSMTARCRRLCFRPAGKGGKPCRRACPAIYDCLWQEPAMGQQPQLQPQVDLPCFLSLIRLKTAAEMIPIRISVTMIVPA